MAIHSSVVARGSVYQETITERERRLGGAVCSLEAIDVETLWAGSDSMPSHDCIQVSFSTCSREAHVFETARAWLEVRT